VKLSPTGHLLPPLVVCALAITVAYAAFGITIVEKSLTALAMPVGLVWLILLAWVYICFCLGQRKTAIGAGIALMLVWGFGNFFVANALVKNLERPFLGFEPADLQPLDVVAVLGGGTTTNANAQPQLARSGERIAMAAKLFLAGKTDRIICTGTQTYISSDDDLDTAEESKAILVKLAIEPESIDTIPGANTSQEMQQLKKWLANHPDAQRIGIITSAWHLKRAMRLAKATGIDATPIPADFLSRYPTVSSDWIIPSSENLDHSTLAIKEYLAALVGR
jgi:uncharacterized SAM-binding protein YcdF (DUF218 family)